MIGKSKKVQAAIEAVVTAPEKPNSQHKSREVTQAERLLELMKPQTALFHDQYREPYATFEVIGRTETHPVRSKFFKRWAANIFYESEAKPIGPAALNSALIVLEAGAVFSNASVTLHNRVSWHNGALLYDLSDEQWRAVQINEGGWELIAAPQIFRRFQHQASQQPPIKPAKASNVWEEFRKLLNVRSEDWILLFGYLGSLFIPGIPHAILVLHGPKGASKTTINRTFRQLADPSHIGVLSFPRDKHELVQQLSHHWVAYYDNISQLPQWLSDSLCKAISGEGFSKRELYSDDEDVLYFIRCCAGLNGINVAATAPDLLDRSLLIGVERISQDRRLSEREYWDAFNKLLPHLLGSIFDFLSKTLTIHRNMRLKEKPRMADFAEWAEAFCQAAGYQEGAFMTAYLANIGVQNEEAVSSHVVGSAILAFMECREHWQGSAAELLNALLAEAETLKLDTFSKGWPKAPHAFTRRLKEIITDLNEIGISVSIWRISKGVQVRIERKKTPEKATLAALATPPSTNSIVDSVANVGSAAISATFSSKLASIFFELVASTKDGLVPREKLDNVAALNGIQPESVEAWLTESAVKGDVYEPRAGFFTLINGRPSQEVPGVEDV